MTEDPLAADARRELLENILPFWRRRAPDEVRGGFIGELSNDLRVRDDAPRSLILTARILWTFSAVFRVTGSPQDAGLAGRALDEIVHRFRDPQEGGYVWALAPDGRVLDGNKKIYGQAFCIYALAEHHRAFRDTASLEEAIAVYHLLDGWARDREEGGYAETLSPDWKPVADVRLSDKDMNAARSMNNHLHLLEAYTSLLGVWTDAGLAARLRELIDLFGRRILDHRGAHLRHFFDRTWTPLSDSYTFGHDIEASWLLCEAADVLGGEVDLQRQARAAALGLAEAALREGLDADGGLLYEGCDGRIINAGKEWWPQAEAVVGFYNAWQLTGDPIFREAAVGCWRYIQNHVVDTVHGEWFWRILPDGTPDPAEPKISAWKCPYHNSRCCLEIIRRAASADNPRIPQ